MERWLGLAETALRAVRPGLPELDAVRCLPARHRGGGCTACHDVCPQRALGGGAVPRADAYACDGCAACVAVCPTGALRSAALANAIEGWLASIAAGSGGTALVGCERARRPGDPSGGRVAAELRLPCLGALRAADILAAAARGAGEITLGVADCDSCDRATAGAASARAVDVARTALSALGSPVTVRRVRVTGASDGAARPDDAGPDLSDTMSRRGLFEMWRNTARRGVAEVIRETESPADHVLGYGAVPPWRQRLESDVGTVAARSGGGGALPVGIGIGLPTVEGACDGCGMCALVCPFRALSVVGGALSCQVAACTACGLCVAVCPTGGLALRQVAPGAVPAAPPCRPEWQPPVAPASESGLAARAAAADRRMKAAGLRAVVGPREPVK